MTEITEFLSVLLSIEVAVFGVMFAGILVFLQLLYQKYPYSDIKTILQTKKFITFCIITALHIIAIIFSSYITLYDGQIFYETVTYSDLKTYIAHPSYILVLLVSLIALFIFAVNIIYTILKYLDDREIFLLIKSQITHAKITNYIYGKYGVYGRTIKEIEDARLKLSRFDKQDVSKTSEHRKLEKELLLKWVSAFEKADGSRNPFEPFYEILYQSIPKLSQNTIVNAGDVLYEIIEEYISRNFELNEVNSTYVIEDASKRKIDDNLFQNFNKEITSSLLQLTQVALDAKSARAASEIINLIASYRNILKNNNLVAYLDEVWWRLEYISEETRDLPHYQYIYQYITDLFVEDFLYLIDGSEIYTVEENQQYVPEVADERRSALEEIVKIIIYIIERDVKYIKKSDDLLDEEVGIERIVAEIISTASISERKLESECIYAIHDIVKSTSEALANLNNAVSVNKRHGDENAIRLDRLIQKYFTYLNRMLKDFPENKVMVQSMFVEVVHLVGSTTRGSDLKIVKGMMLDSLELYLKLNDITVPIPQLRLLDVLSRPAFTTPESDREISSIKANFLEFLKTGCMDLDTKEATIDLLRKAANINLSESGNVPQPISDIAEAIEIEI